MDTRTSWLAGERSSPSNGRTGGDQWAGLWADGGADWNEVEELTERSYRVVALKGMLMALQGNPRRR
jgi:hypothetical protein